MLSTTWTIEDVKNKLKKTYDFYDFNSDDEFEAALIDIAEEVKYLYMYPHVAPSDYSDIEDKDKVALTRQEMYIYLAEVYFICYKFIKSDDRTRGQREDSTGSESLKVEGYQHSVNNSTGSNSQADESRNAFLKDAYAFMSKAGYDLYGLERTCSIFGTTAASVDLTETND